MDHGVEPEVQDGVGVSDDPPSGWAAIATLKCGIPERTLRRWCESGQIKARKYRQAWYIPLEALKKGYRQGEKEASMRLARPDTPERPGAVPGCSRANRADDRTRERSSKASYVAVNDTEDAMICFIDNRKNLMDSN